MVPGVKLLFALCLLLSACSGNSPPLPTSGTSSLSGAQPTRDFAAQVNPFVGTQSGAKNFGTGGGAGNTYPGAVVPFGMLQFSPDTVPSTDNGPGGYSYEDTKIGGFSLTRLSGAGCAILGDIPVMQVQSVTLNGQPLSRAWLRFSDIASGATLHYRLGDAASDWAQAAADTPPSYPVTTP